MRFHPSIFLWFLVLAAVLSPAACGRDPAPAPAATSPLAGRSTPFDVATVMATVRFAFRPDGSRHRAEHATYQVIVDEGRVGIAPRQGRAREAGAPIELATTAVRRGPASLAAERPRARVAADGHLVIERGAAAEELRNGPAGVEQSWAFVARPEGSGDLEIRVAARGLGFAGSTAGGLHFAGAGGPGFRYGHGTWVDAGGRRSPVEATWDGEAIALRVPAAIVDASAYPARLDPTVGPEFAVDDPVPGPADGTQAAPSLAFDGTNYLVFWEDAMLRATRVTPAGVVLDPSGILIDVPGYVDTVTSAASNGSGFLVAWSTLGPGKQDQCWAARISASGQVLDPAGILVATTADVSFVHPAVASLAGDYLVAYLDVQTVSAKRVSAAGAVLDASPIVVSGSAMANWGSPAVTAGPSQYLVAWSTNATIAANAVSPQGTVASPAGFTVYTSPGGYDPDSPSLAYGGGQYLAGWRNRQISVADDQVMAARISSSLTVLDPNGIIINGTHKIQDGPVVASDGTDFFVAYDVSMQGTLGFTFQLLGSRVSAAGAVLQPAGVSLSTVTPWWHVLALGSDGVRYLLVDATSGFVSTGRLEAARLTPDGVSLDPNGILLATGANGETEPAVAAGGTSYLVVWTDDRAGVGQTGVYGALVSAQGTMLTPSGIAISPAAAMGSAPRVAGNAGGYLVVWSAHGGSSTLGTWGTLVAKDGTVTNPAGFQIHPTAGLPDVATDGTDFLVTYSYVGVGAKRVSAAGQVLDPAGIGFTTSGADLNPHVASDGTDYLLSWERSNQIYAARVTAAGQVLDAAGLKLSTSSKSQVGNAVASNHKGYLVAWSDSGSGIVGTVVTSLGLVVTPGGVPFGPQETLITGRVAAGSDGTGYVVAWAPAKNKIHAAWVAPGGGVLGGVNTIEDEGQLLTSPAVAASAPGNWLVVHSEFVDVAPFTAYRVHGHVLTGDTAGLAAGTSCTNAALCASGFCVDGVCCDAACGGGDPTDCQACSVSHGAPADGHCAPVAAATVCHAPTGTCDAPGICDGTSTACPPDAPLPDGTPCDDLNPCTTGETCHAGACTSPPPQVCTPPDPCQIGACLNGGGCSFKPRADGTACPGGTCHGGTCAPTPTGTGGSGGSGGGSSSASSSSSGAVATTHPGGCGCRTADRGEGSAPVLLALFALAALARRRPRPQPVRSSASA